MQLRTACLATLLLAFPLALSAFQFDVSPHPDGSIDTRIAFDWSYNDLPLFSGLVGSYITEISDDSASDSYYATVSRSLMANADLIGYRNSWGGFGLSVSANGEYDRMVIREIGYQDLNSIRYFILNDKTIDLFLPRLKVSCSLDLAPFHLSAKGEYSLWLYVKLAQGLTISPGFPMTAFSSEQSGNSAFSVDTELAFDLPVLRPHASVGYDRIPLAYTALTAAGQTRLDTVIETIRAQFELELDFISVGTLHPTLLARYEKTTTTDLTASATFVEDGDWVFGFGLR